MPGRTARTASSIGISLRAVPCVGIAALALVIGSNSLQSVVANGDTRSISMQHTHRDDAITVTFKRNGRYDADGLKKLNYFLRDWRNDDVTQMDPQLFDILWEVTRELDTDQPIRIVSSYRSPATNSMLRRRSRGVAKFSQHMLGKAIDFNIQGASVEQLRAIAMRLQRGGVGFYPGSFVHVDVGSVRHWPRMTHDQLARVFPNGRTVHVPSDGQPLSGYALALADIEKRGTSGPSQGPGAGRTFDTERVASASTGPKKGILSKLFGFSTEEPDDDEESTPRGKTTVASRAVVEEPQQVAAARVPLPPARPAGIDARAKAAAPAGGGFALASASSTAVTLPPARTVPRPPAELNDTVTERAETTSSITAWLNDAEFGSKPDRVSPGLALAYAANATPEGTRPVALTPPMPAARMLPAQPNATSQMARIPPKPGQRYNDPWMRSITLATSVHSDMNVSVYGKLDVRQVRMMMIKPAMSVAMGFGRDPFDGMQTLRFSGAAVAFLPTIEFGHRQASLR